MKNALIVGVAAAVVFVLATAAVAAAKPTARSTTVATAPPGLGRIIVDARGHSLYLFEKDTHGQSDCSGVCAVYWPPLITHGKSIAIKGAKASLLVAFEDDFEPAAIMAEAAHGTAPSLEGKNVANPMAMILAGAALLSHTSDEGQQAGRAIREACLEAVAQGGRTADLGGDLGTTEFTDEVIRRVQAKLEVWATL